MWSIHLNALSTTTVHLQNYKIILINGVAIAKWVTSKMLNNILYMYLMNNTILASGRDPHHVHICTRSLLKMLAMALVTNSVVHKLLSTFLRRLVNLESALKFIECCEDGHSLFIFISIGKPLVTLVNRE